jgi:hypothetical protein
MNDGHGIKPRRTATPKQLAAWRANGRKGGRPKGKLSPYRAALRDVIQSRQPEIVAKLFELMHRGESHAIKLAAARELLDRGWGRPVQLTAVGVGGEGPAIIQVVTGVPRRDDFLPSMPSSADSPSATRMH